MSIEIHAKDIENLEIKTKIVEEKAEGVVVRKRLITNIKLDAETTPGKFDPVLKALKAGYRVNFVLYAEEPVPAIMEE